MSYEPTAVQMQNIDKTAGLVLAEIIKAHAALDTGLGFYAFAGSVLEIAIETMNKEEGQFRASMVTFLSETEKSECGGTA